MQGFVDDELQPKIKLRAKGLRKMAEIEAVIDTGFSGDLCLPLTLQSLGRLNFKNDKKFDQENFFPLTFSL